MRKKPFKKAQNGNMGEIDPMMLEQLLQYEQDHGSTYAPNPYSQPQPDPSESSIVAAREEAAREAVFNKINALNSIKPMRDGGQFLSKFKSAARFDQPNFKNRRRGIKK